MKCPNCGAEVESGAKFCGICGSPLPREAEAADSGNAWQEQQPVHEEQPAYEEQPSAYGEQAPFGQQSASEQPAYEEQAPSLGEPAPFGQQPVGEQPAYGQPAPFGQQPMYGEQVPYGQQPAGPLPFYASTWFVILMLLFIGPVGLFLMWRFEKFSKVVRIIITVLLVMVWISNFLGS